jgi:hypothetical protein
VSCYIASRHRWEVEIYVYPLLTRALQDGGLSVPLPSLFTPGKKLEAGDNRNIRKNEIASENVTVV